MKTILRITNDIYSTLSYDMFIEDITYLVNELNLFCKIANNSMVNNVEDKKLYLSSESEYTDKLIVEAKGYSQGDWQEFTLYYNEADLKDKQKKAYFESLVTQLERSFTHLMIILANYLKGKKLTVKYLMLNLTILLHSVLIILNFQTKRMLSKLIMKYTVKITMKL